MCTGKQLLVPKVAMRLFDLLLQHDELQQDEKKTDSAQPNNRKGQHRHDTSATAIAANAVVKNSTTVVRFFFSTQLNTICTCIVLF